MWESEREQCLETVHWNLYPKSSNKNDSFVALECWDYEGEMGPIENRNYRVLTLAGEQRRTGLEPNRVDERLKDWIDFSDPYFPLKPPEDAGRLKGGLRLIMCDRGSREAGMSMSRQAYESIEAAFGLHATTLPSLSLNGGTHAKFESRQNSTDPPNKMQMVIKACQKVEVGNYLLSLSHDRSTGWTYAFLCGDGVLWKRQLDEEYGSMYEQLVSAITSSPKFWGNPLFLPSVVFQNYTTRVQIRTGVADKDIIAVETMLGLHSADIGSKEQDWPHGIDTRSMILALNFMVPQVSFMTSCCRWLQKYASFLLELEEELRNDFDSNSSRQSSLELREILLYQQSGIDSLESFFSIANERVNLQTSLIYNVIGQQDSLLSRRDNILNLLIAKSSKQDSISMSTFTFITALFLPATFIATLFSMSMFNWQPDSGDSSSSSSTSSSYVTSNFWIFWATIIPLTLITMAGWFLWFKHADQAWTRELADALNASHATGANEYFLTQMAAQQQREHLREHRLGSENRGPNAAATPGMGPATRTGLAANAEPPQKFVPGWGPSRMKNQRGLVAETKRGLPKWADRGGMVSDKDERRAGSDIGKGQKRSKN